MIFRMNQRGLCLFLIVFLLSEFQMLSAVRGDASSDASHSYTSVLDGQFELLTAIQVESAHDIRLSGFNLDLIHDDGQCIILLDPDPSAASMLRVEPESTASGCQAVIESVELVESGKIIYNGEDIEHQILNPTIEIENTNAIINIITHHVESEKQIFIGIRIEVSMEDASRFPNEIDHEIELDLFHSGYQ